MNRPVETRTSVVERLFVATQGSEPERVLELLHPRVEWTPTVWSGEAMYRGQEGAHLWLDQFGENLEYLDIRLERIELGENRAAALGIVFDTRGGQTFAVKVPWSFEIEDGLIRRGRAHGSWEEALSAVRLGPATPA